MITLLLHHVQNYAQINLHSQWVVSSGGMEFMEGYLIQVEASINGSRGDIPPCSLFMIPCYFPCYSHTSQPSDYQKNTFRLFMEVSTGSSKNCQWEIPFHGQEYSFIYNPVHLAGHVNCLASYVYYPAIRSYVFATESLHYVAGMQAIVNSQGIFKKKMN